MIALGAECLAVVGGPIVVMVLGGYWATRSARPERRAQRSDR